LANISRRAISTRIFTPIVATLLASAIGDARYLYTLSSIAKEAIVTFSATPFTPIVATIFADAIGSTREVIGFQVIGGGIGRFHVFGEGIWLLLVKREDIVQFHVFGDGIRLLLVQRGDIGKFQVRICNGVDTGIGD